MARQLTGQTGGDNYHIIEEGLNGRTTNITPSDFPYKNGKSYLLPCLYSHAPLDLVILLLGANDLKHEIMAKHIAEKVQAIFS